MITARSTSTRLPWEGSPQPSMPPSVTLSEGSSTSEGPGEIQSTATPSEGSSTSEGPTGIQSRPDDSKIVVTTDPQSEAQNSMTTSPDTLR